jgi:hypothetical protein
LCALFDVVLAELAGEVVLSRRLEADVPTRP